MFRPYSQARNEAPLRRVVHRALPGSAFVLIPALILAGCAGVPKEKLHPAATSLLAGTTTAMNGSGYWIARHPAPDEPILDAAGIAALNAEIRVRGHSRDLSSWTPLSADELAKELRGAAGWVRDLKVFQADGRKLNEAFMAPLVDLMDIESAGFWPAERGFLVSQTDLRALPTKSPLYDGPGDPHIDNLQASSLEPGQPVVVLHRSRDGAWRYVAAELASGWVPASAVAVADEASFLRRYREAESATVIAGRADLFSDEPMTRFATYVRMGARLVLSGESTDAAVGISMPFRDAEGGLREEVLWVATDEISREPLPYTPRTIYRQAFRLLNAPYGWGGSFGQQDCSQFLCQVFSTVGVTLPRNSTRQAKTGTPLPSFRADLDEEEKARVIAEGGIGGATLLRFPGHIMLYLGEEGGEPYAIHSTWSYLEKRGSKDLNRLVNRVAVSDLRLGSTGKKGSHLHRLIEAVIVRPNPPSISQ